MNKKILLLLGLSWIFVGCVNQLDSRPPASLDCKSYTATSTCDDLGNNPSVTINLDEKTVEPECVQAKKNGVVVFKIESKGKIKKNSVGIFPKDDKDDEWLAGRNNPNKNRIFVGVPEKGKKGKSLPLGDHSYGVWTKDWCIDPRINVKN